MPFRLLAVVKHTASAQLAAGAAEHHHGELGGVVAAVHHAGAEEEHRVVERGALAFLNRVELAGQVGELLDEELVHLEPVRGVGVGEQVVNHVVDAEMGEAERRVIVVQLER